MNCLPGQVSEEKLSQVDDLVNGSKKAPSKSPLPVNFARVFAKFGDLLKDMWVKPGVRYFH